MKRFFALMSLVIIVSADAQVFDSNFKTIAVNKSVKEFPDKFDLSSPLSSFLTFKYTMMNGKDGMFWKTSCSVKRPLLPDSSAPNSDVPDEMRQSYLNTIVREIIVYKDSVAFVISQMHQDSGEPYYSVRNFHPERGKWVNNGEDLFKTIPSAYKGIRDHVGRFYEDFQACQKQLNGGAQLNRKD